MLCAPCPSGLPAGVAIGKAVFLRARDLLGKYRVVRRIGAESTLPIDVRVIAATGVDLEAAIAAAFEVPLADVQWAGMLTGDLGQTAPNVEVTLLDGETRLEVSVGVEERQDLGAAAVLGVDHHPVRRTPKKGLGAR